MRKASSIRPRLAYEVDRLDCTTSICFSDARRRRSKESILLIQGNLAATYQFLGRDEEALRLWQDVYSKRLKLMGEEHVKTLLAATNYAAILIDLKRFEEAKLLLRKRIPAARRVLGESHVVMLWMRRNYAEALCRVDGATLDDVREAVNTLEETERTARRVLGGAHPDVAAFEKTLRNARADLRARETPGDDA